MVMMALPQGSLGKAQGLFAATSAWPGPPRAIALVTVRL
jgi:hypothetical protein